MKRLILFFLVAQSIYGQCAGCGSGGGGGSVSSVFGRTGSVAATSGDYSASLVTNAVDATQTYSNPGWISALAGSKITGSISILGPLVLSGSGTGNLVMTNGSTPTAPSTGSHLLFFNSSTSNHLSVETSAGSVRDLESTGTSAGWVLVESHTASSSVDLEFTSCPSATYDSFVYVFSSILPVTSAANLQMLFSTNGGTSWDTASHYLVNFFVYRAGGSSLGGDADTATSAFNLTTSVVNGGVSNTTSEGLSGMLNLSAVSGVFPQMTGNLSMNAAGGSHWLAEGLQAAYVSTTAPNATQIKFSSGNIASGTVRCYALTH